MLKILPLLLLLAACATSRFSDAKTEFIEIDDRKFQVRTIEVDKNTYDVQVAIVALFEWVGGQNLEYKMQHVNAAKIALQKYCGDKKPVKIEEAMQGKMMRFECQ